MADSKFVKEAKKAAKDEIKEEYLKSCKIHFKMLFGKLRTAEGYLKRAQAAIDQYSIDASKGLIEIDHARDFE